ncbi:hypothetical protein Vafri_6821 [Volvox africanus]|uniref:C2 domain-containing protein n=1 Tax=Volvox africanus TaxID=51714 RepID=A0A8J4EZY4_9CHLO|nr:hypothetical protein Vafri_6821 [Volvox africanus]
MAALKYIIAAGAAGGPITIGLAAACFGAAGFLAGSWSSSRKQGLGKAARIAHSCEVVEDTEAGEGENDPRELLLEFLSDSPIVPSHLPTLLRVTDAKRGDGRSLVRRLAVSHEEEGEFDIERADILLDLAMHAYKNPQRGQGYKTQGLESSPAVTFFDKAILTAIYNGVLVVNVERATGLRPLRGKGDVSAYAQVTIQSSLFRTKAVRNTASPVWNATFTVFLGDTNWESLAINVFDNNRNSELLGNASLGLGDLMANPGRDTQLRLPLISPQGAAAGTIHMNCRYISFQETDPDDISELTPITETLDKVDSNKFSDMKPMGGLKPAAFIDSKSTDTQVWLHSDVAQRKLVVSFRGTEKFADILTDVAMAPCKFNPILEDDKYAQIFVHGGFMNALKSVHQELGALVRAITSEQDQPWQVEVTGHSLGGALATLAAYELAVFRNQAGKVKSVKLYTYGCPRVGNNSFAKDFDKVLRDAWRITNRLDLVPSVPPSGVLFKFTHAGNPVRLRDDGCFHKGVENLTEDIERDINWFTSIASLRGIKEHSGAFYKDMLTNAKKLLGMNASTSAASTTGIPAKAGDPAAKIAGEIIV